MTPGTMARFGWLTVVLGTLACSSASTPGAVDADHGGEARPVDACVTFSAQTDTCMLAFGAATTLSGTLTYDTDAGMLVDDQGMPVAVSTTTIATQAGEVSAILATAIALAPDTRLRAVGSRGFAIVAASTIAFGAGAIVDVSDGGAGARTDCPGAPTSGGNQSGGAAGGGGGGFGSEGGTGGRGNADGTTAAGGAAGTQIALPPGPLGGCRGGEGGDSANQGGAGGGGGGAVWLAAGLQIDIASGGGVNASGGGGAGGTRASGDGDAGGGGGGSGGLIWLEAPRVRSSGTLAANGGGGGEGSGDGSAGRAGTAGLFGTNGAPGGSGGTPTGTDGGLGGSRDLLPGASVTTIQDGGGGGGGGGVGFVHAVSLDATLGNLVSPPAS